MGYPLLRILNVYGDNVGVVMVKVSLIIVPYILRLGFTDVIHPTTEKVWARSFRLNLGQSEGHIDVVIHESQKLSPHATPKYVGSNHRKGWVMVDVAYVRPQSRWQYYANKLLNRTR